MAPETLTAHAEVELLGGRMLRLPETANLHERIGAVLADQQEVISTGQLTACGLSASAARARARSGRLRRVHRGVYTAVSSDLPPLGQVAAALLACGPRASASHRTAAWMRELRGDVRRTVDVSSGSRTGLRHHHVVVHRGTALRERDVSLVSGIPVTSVPRTLLDCAPILGERGTEKLVREAEYRGVLDIEALHDVLAHVRGHRGRGVLRSALGEALAVPGRTESPGEDALLYALRALAVTGFECNPEIDLGDGSRVRPDFLFRAEHLVVEVDPRSSHDRTSSYRDDRRRDRRLKRLADLDTVRFSDVDMRDPAACAREVRDRVATERLRLRSPSERKRSSGI